MELSEAKILITGGAQGIGNYLALELLNSVKRVVIIDINQSLLDQIPNHDKLSKYVCDLTKYEDVNKIVTEIFQKDGGINVLINNAGIIHSEPLINLLGRPDRKHSVERWNKVVDINLNSVFYVTSCVSDQMIQTKERGVIVNISSIAAQGNIGQSAYSATKAAVEALTKTWSKELSMFKIRSVCIAPGFFNTNSTKASLSEAMLTKWEKAVPIGRLGELKELLLAVRFLIENDYFNGKVLKVDGGLNL